MSVRRRVVLATAATASVLIALAPGSWGQSAPAPGSDGPPAAGTGVVHSFALAPTGSADPSQPGNRPNLSYEATAGSSIDDAVTLFNYSNVQLTFRVYATDAFNNPDGEFDLLPGDRNPTEVGTWVKVPQANITVPAGSQATMPITIDVPIDARPGDHAGAVLASSQAEGTGPDGKVIAFDRRTGPRLYIRVAGRLTPELAIEDLETVYQPSLNPLAGAVEVKYRVENRGNVRLGGDHRVVAGGPFGLGAKQGPKRKLPELLPGQGVTLRATLDGVAATGLARTEISVDPAPVGDGLAGMADVKRRSRMLAVPLTLLAVAVAATLLRYARRSARRHRHEALGAGASAR